MQKTLAPFHLMPSKTIATLLGIITASLFCGSVAEVEAAPSGSGSINANFATPSRLVLDYSVQGNGSGTAEFACRAVSSTGRVFNQSKASTYWSNGKASAQFVFVDLQDKGYYSITCEWKPFSTGVTYHAILHP